MKTILRLIIVFISMSWLAACANNNKIYEDFCHGMYDSANQFQRAKNPEMVVPPEKESITYEKYKNDRQEILNDGRH